MLADAFIAIDYATRERRSQTVAQHERILKALAVRSRARLLKSIHDHRDATGVGARAGMLHRTT